MGGKSQGRGGGRVNQKIKSNTITGNRGRFGGAKVTANRLRNKQGSLQRVGLFIIFGCVFFLFYIFLVTLSVSCLMAMNSIEKCI